MHIVILDEQDAQTGFFAYKPHHITQIKRLVPKATVSLVKAKETDRDKKIRQGDILLLHSMRYINPSKLPNLKWIHATFAGVDSLAAALAHLPIRLTNSSGVHPIPISEQVIGYMLMFARSLHTLHAVQITKGIWDQHMEKHPVFEMAGTTVGIVGLGHIGERIAKLAYAFDMKVLSYSVHKKELPFITKSYVRKQLADMIKECDFIVNCLPLTQQTTSLFDKKMFKLMKRSAFFINIGRGPTVHEKDLIEALNAKTIAGAALDVFEKEPLPPSSQLWKLPNVILTPHMAGWTPKYIDRMIDIFCENLKAYIASSPMPTEVDKRVGY